MPKFASMLANGMRKHGHEVTIWSPKPVLCRYSSMPGLKKWLGYIDSFIVFPFWVKRQLKKRKTKTLFVFTDQALGPWIPLISDNPHVIHCHDFLAQRSALDEIPENPVGWFGKRYQAYQYQGYRRGKNFISVSESTRTDLKRFLINPPLASEVIYNGLNQFFEPGNYQQARKILSEKTGIDLNQGFLLHVGGNQWNKNRKGVLEIYNAWRSDSDVVLPLLMIGYKAEPDLNAVYEASPYKNDIHFLSGKEDEFVRMAYVGATVFLFPSLAEGFGWPIAEAMASGCPVITTNLAPMTEVAGGAALLINPRPAQKHKVQSWAQESAEMLKTLLFFSEEQREQLIQNGLQNAKRFSTENTIAKIEVIYQTVMDQDETRQPERHQVLSRHY